MQALSQLSYTPHGQHEIIRAEALLCKRTPADWTGRAARRGRISSRHVTPVIATARSPRRPMPLPSPHAAADVDLSGRVIMVTGASRRTRPAARARLRGAWRHGGAARARRAQARGALRRDRRGRTSAADDPPARPGHGVRRRFRQCRGRDPRAARPAGRARARGGLPGLAGADRAPVVRRVAEGAARQPGRGDGADAIDAAAALRRPRRERHLHARHARRGPARLLGRLRRGQGRPVGAGRDAGRRMGKPARTCASMPSFPGRCARRCAR